MSLRAADLGIVAFVKTLAAGLVITFGFRAVSDDDFARVVLAQSFAESPKLDPTGTSWLPFPFWITGAAMIVAGRTLLVARISAFVLGLFSALLVALAARRLATHRSGALLGAVLAAAFPWSARLGVATVPELPTAALALFAMASLAGPLEPRPRILGALALFGATLSRYDIWPIAAAFSAFTALDAFRASHPSSPSILPPRLSRRDRLLFGLAALLSLLGPALWILWNHLTRSGPFDFLDRVAAYRRALGGPADAPLSRLFAYPLAMARHEPELFGALVILITISILPSLRALAFRTIKRYSRPLIIASFQLIALSLALVKDGAPTHHPERALLVGFLLCALLVGDLAATLLPKATRSTRLAVLFASLTVLIFSLVIVRRWFRGEDFIPREAEVAMGRAVKARALPSDRILLEAVDYGHFALTAAFGRPEAIVLDRDLDPRKPLLPSSFDDPARLSARAREARARYVLGRKSAPVAAHLGPPRLQSGPFALWDAPSPQALP